MRRTWELEQSDRNSILTNLFFALHFLMNHAHGESQGLKLNLLS